MPVVKAIFEGLSILVIIILLLNSPRNCTVYQILNRRMKAILETSYALCEMNNNENNGDCI